MNRLSLHAHTLSVALLALASACASGGASTKSESARITPPKMVRSSTPARPFEASPVDARVEVMINERGEPDMSTFRVTGRVSATNRDVLRLWIQDSRYTPAQQGGQPVAGLFEMAVRNSTLTRIR